MHPSLALLKYSLGKNYFKQKNYSKAEYYFEDSLRDYKKIFGNKNRELQNVLEDLAILNYLTNDFKKQTIITIKEL